MKIKTLQVICPPIQKQMGETKENYDESWRRGYFTGTVKDTGYAPVGEIKLKTVHYPHLLEEYAVFATAECKPIKN